MANFSLISPTIHTHDLDLTTYLKKVTLKSEAAELDVTTFGSAGYRSRIGGLRTVSLNGDGFWDSVPDLSVFSALGVADRVTTICPQGAETNTAYLFQGGRFTYDQYGSVGEATPFSISSMSTNSQGLIRGQMAKVKGTVSGTGQLGSILTMAGPTASQFLYASAHLFTVGTTITIQIQSATTLGFAGPTTRATIGPLTVVGGTFMTRVPGPFTDGFWRANVSAVTGTFTAACAIGIG